METAMTAEQQGPRLQQVTIQPNAIAIGTEMKERSYLPTEDLRYTGNSNKIPFPPMPALK